MKQSEVLVLMGQLQGWCLDTFSVHKHERHALNQLENVCQTGSVAEYKAAHAAQTSHATASFLVGTGLEG